MDALSRAPRSQHGPTVASPERKFGVHWPASCAPARTLLFVINGFARLDGLSEHTSRSVSSKLFNWFYALSLLAALGWRGTREASR